MSQHRTNTMQNQSQTYLDIGILVLAIQTFNHYSDPVQVEWWTQTPAAPNDAVVGHRNRMKRVTIAHIIRN